MIIPENGYVLVVIKIKELSWKICHSHFITFQFQTILDLVCSLYELVTRISQQSFLVSMQTVLRTGCEVVA